MVCDSGFLLDSNLCKPCEDFLGLYTNELGECAEYCGDSIKAGINECDDGNVLDFDGCSS